MPRLSGLSRHEPGEIFLSGLDGGVPARHLRSTSGILVSGFVNADPARQPALVHNPADSFVAGLTLQAHEMSLWSNGKLVRDGWLPSGSVNFSDPTARIASESEGPWELLFLILPRTLIAQVGEAAELGGGMPELGFFNAHGKTFPRLLGLAREAQREVMAPGPFSQLRADLIGQSLIIEMLLHHSSWSPDLAERLRRPARGGLSPQQLRRAHAIMDAELERNLTLGELARAVGCSPTHFSRAFKQSTGIAPFAWLLHRRVDRAKALLRQPATPIADIALAVGFSAQPQFTTAFRRITGQTPAAWRRSAMS